MIKNIIEQSVFEDLNLLIEKLEKANSLAEKLNQSLIKEGDLPGLKRIKIDEIPAHDQNQSEWPSIHSDSTVRIG